MDNNIFEELFKIDVSSKVEKKKTGGTELTYLSWAWAWAEVKKKYPEAQYEIKRYNDLPYVYDDNTGYMVFTEVTIGTITHEMWLPVMDGANKAMKASAYEYTTKYGKKAVEPATMFDVNKTIMRCLVKNLAMHGLGLYIYAGEDLPESVEDLKVVDKVDPEMYISEAQQRYICELGPIELVKKTLLEKGYTKSGAIKEKDYESICATVRKAVAENRQ